MKINLFIVILILALLMAGCIALPDSAGPATPTVDPDIYNQVPATTVFEPGQCTAVLESTVPAHTSNTLGGQPSSEIPAGQYEVGVAADYGSSLWYGLNGVGAVNWINSASVSALTGDCTTKK